MKTTSYSLTAEQSARLAQLRAMNDNHNAAWERHASFGRGGWSSADAAQQARIVAACGFDFTNELRAELETLEFLADPPARYFAYPSADCRSVSGFMGNTLARINHLGREFRSCFGDTRQNFRAVGINGRTYAGTIYGTYLRMKECA